MAYGLKASSCHPLRGEEERICVKVQRLSLSFFTVKIVFRQVYLYVVIRDKLIVTRRKYIKRTNKLFLLAVLSLGLVCQLRLLTYTVGLPELKNRTYLLDI